MPARTTTAAAAPAPATAAQASLYQQLRGHLAELKLHDAAGALPAVLDTAAAEGLTTTAALERLLAIEVSASQARRLAGRLRFASLPSPATLEDFDYDAAPAIDPALIAELATCRYLENATNVLLIGPPGLGKTHLAIDLARKAAEAGYRTYFTTAADLAARCHRAAIEGRWATTMRFFNGPGLLVIDELGYLPLPAEAASALFQVISQRYLKTSIILTRDSPQTVETSVVVIMASMAGLLAPVPGRGRLVACPLFLLPGAAVVSGSRAARPSPAGRCGAPLRPEGRPRTLSGRKKASGGAAASFSRPAQRARRAHAASFPARDRS